MNVKLQNTARIWLIAIFVAIASVPSVFARDFSYRYEGKTLWYTVIDEAAKTCMTKAGNWEEHNSGNSVRGDLIIPSVAKDGDVEYSVTSIGEYAFRGCSGLTSVDIPNSVISIDSQAFCGCSGLASVTIGNSVTSIGESVFSSCEKLVEVTIPNSVTSIGGGAFSACYVLTSVSIPSSVITIGDYAFAWCRRLTSVDIPNSVTKIGECTFESCDNLRSVSIPNSVTEIGERAFVGCSSLTTVAIPNSVIKIGEFAFSVCRSLTEINVAPDNPSYSSREGILYNKEASTLISCPEAKVSVNIPNSVTSIGEWAFYECSGLTSVDIPNSVTSIGEYAFRGCSGLTSVDIPNSVTEIGERAFDECNGLTSVTIPNSVTEIGDYALCRCDKLAEVNYKTTDPITFRNKAIFSQRTYESATLNLAIGGFAKAYSTEPWKYFRYIEEKEFSSIEEVMIDIDSNAPVEVFNLNGVRISDSVNNLPAGIYIVRQGAKEHKIMVK